MDEKVLKAFIAEITGQEVNDIEVVSIEKLKSDDERCPICGEVHGNEPEDTDLQHTDHERAKRNRDKVARTVAEKIEAVERVLPQLKELAGYLARPMEELTPEESKREMTLTLNVMLSILKSQLMSR